MHVFLCLTSDFSFGEEEEGETEMWGVGWEWLRRQMNKKRRTK